MLYFALGWALTEIGDGEEARQAFAQAEAQSPDCCFPSRLEELVLLKNQIERQPNARASYYLGNLLYGKRQYEAAIRAWEDAAKQGEAYYVLYRNLGMAAYNNRQDGTRALGRLAQAREAEPGNPQLLFESNYLMQRTNQPFEVRLRLLESHAAIVRQRDDLYMELIRVQPDGSLCQSHRTAQQPRLYPVRGRRTRTGGTLDLRPFLPRQACVAGG